MLFFISIGLGIMVFVFMKMTRKNEPVEHGLIIGFGSIFASMILGMAIDVETDVVYPIDGGLVHNEVYAGENHYYITSNGNRVIVPSSSDDVEFFVSDANEATKECQELPSWAWPWGWKNCDWVVRAEHVE